MQKIWAESDAFNRFRGTEWMPEPCHSCDRREIDWAGCRCQMDAFVEFSGSHQGIWELSLDGDVHRHAVSHLIFLRADNELRWERL